MINYEWDVETIEEMFGDIMNHRHGQTIIEATQGLGLETNERLVLICDQTDKFGELVERSWAYVEDGQLPQKFDNGRKVPKRFHEEMS